MYLVFDVETNGLPKSKNAPVTDVDNYPRIIQLGWQLYDVNRRLMGEYCQLIKPDGWTVPLAEFWQLNGYYTEINQREGIPIRQALISLREAMGRAQYLIAHNILFDGNVTGSEFVRAGLTSPYKLQKICTCEYGKRYTEIPTGNGYRPPKLGLLYKAITGKEFTGAHDALNDCRACIECFFVLLDNGFIPPIQRALFE
jgi:DNA polymerase III epsilon subunit-like protein